MWKVVSDEGGESERDRVWVGSCKLEGPKRSSLESRRCHRRVQRWSSWVEEANSQSRGKLPLVLWHFTRIRPIALSIPRASLLTLLPSGDERVDWFAFDFLASLVCHRWYSFCFFPFTRWWSLCHCSFVVYSYKSSSLSGEAADRLFLAFLSFVCGSSSPSRLQIFFQRLWQQS